METINASSLLPRQADSNGLALVKLKKLKYRRHIYFEPVHKMFIILEYFKHNNEL